MILDRIAHAENYLGINGELDCPSTSDGGQILA